MIYFIMALPPLLALFNTGSRSSWIGFAVSVIVITFLLNKRLLPFIILGGVMMIPFLPSMFTTGSYHFQSRTGYFNPDQGQDFADCGTNVQTLYAVGGWPGFGHIQATDSELQTVYKSSSASYPYSVFADMD